MLLGDRNTKFFYSAVKSRQAKNHIAHLISEEGVAVSDMNVIKGLAPAYYENLFNQSSYWTVFPQVLVKKKLTSRASQWLSRKVTSQEIRMLFFKCIQRRLQVQMVSMLSFSRKTGIL